MDKKLYDLTPAHGLIFKQLQFSLNKACMNIPTSIFIKKKLDMDLLEEALREAIGRWDSFGMRITKVGKEHKLYFTDREALSIKRKDFTGKSPEKMEAFFAKESGRKIPIKDSPMARFFLVTTPEGWCGVFYVVSHMIMDSWAITTFLKDVLEIYLHKAEGAPYPKDVRSYEAALQKELEYLKSEDNKRSMEYWKAELGKGEPFYTHPAGSGMLEAFRKKKGNPELRYNSTFFPLAKGKHKVLSISPEVVEKMVSFVTEEGLTSLSVVFEMALRTYLGKVNDRQTDVSFYNVLSRRATLEEKLCGGTRVQNVILHTVMPESMTFREGLNLLMEKNNESFRNSGFSPLQAMMMWREMYGLPLGFGYVSTLLTFQPFPLRYEGIELVTNWHSNGTAAMPLYLTVMDGDGTGGLKCYYEYMPSQISEGQIVSMHEYLIRLMLKGAENPEVTIGELYDL